MDDGGLLPLCARCTGLYSGFGIGAATQVLAGRASVMPGHKAVFLAALLLATMLMQALGETWGCWAWSNAGRLGIGLVVGGVLSVLMVPLCRYFLCRRPKVRADCQPLEAVLFMALVGLPLSVIWFPRMLSILAVVSLGGLLMAYGCMNLALAGAVLQFKDRPAGGGRTPALIALALFLFLCEGVFFSLIQPKT